MNKISLFPTILLAALFATAAEPPAPVSVPIGVFSRPAGATLSVDGADRGVTPATVSLSPGAHRARLSVPGGSTTYVSFETGPSPMDVSFALPAPTVTVLVTSDPAGATVTCDGSTVGTTPVLLPETPVGRHVFAFELNGFRPQQTERELAGPAPVRVSARLVSASAVLAVTTEPEGATVSVNGVPRGSSPLTVEGVPEGEASVEISLAGFRPHKSRLRVTAGQTATIHAPLEPLPATLEVITTPAGARVFLDDELKGVSPLSLEGLAPGALRVRIALDGHDPVARTVELAPGVQRVEEFRLAPNAGMVRVATSPAGVTVLVDGKKRGVTAAKADASDAVSEALDLTGLTPGERTISFTCRGYRDETRKVAVERDRTVSLGTVKLVRLFIPDTIVTTAAGSYKGVFVEKTAEFYRLETSPGLIRSIPQSDILRVQLVKNPATE